MPGNPNGVEFAGSPDSSHSLEKCGPERAVSNNRRFQDGVMELQQSGVGQTGSRQENVVHPSRRDVIRADISKRLRHICAHLQDEEFARLVETMVDQKLKGERSRSL